MSDFVQQQNSVCEFSTSDSWVILSPIEQSIKKKIESVGTPLKDWDINIYRGVLTGYNDAFIITTEKRNEILSNCQTEDERHRTEELIRPILRGRDIKRYGYDWANLWLIATFPALHYDIEKYPAVKKYFLSFAEKTLHDAGYGWVVDNYLADYCEQKLSQTGKFIEINGKRITISNTPEKARKKTSNKWFETQDSISYWEDFNKPKIVWARLMRIAQSDIDAFPRFCYAPSNYMVVDSLCFFSGKDIEQIVLALNSEYATWYFFNNVATLDNGGFQMRQQYVEEIPLPDLCKMTSENTDKQIYDGFGFNDEEVNYIRRIIREKKEEILFGGH